MSLDQNNPKLYMLLHGSYQIQQSLRISFFLRSSSSKPRTRGAETDFKKKPRLAEFHDKKAEDSLRDKSNPEPESVQEPTHQPEVTNAKTERGEYALVHGLLELLLVEELEDEEDELAAERRHGGGGGGNPPGARSARPGAWLAPPSPEGAVLAAWPPRRARILGFRRRPSLSPASERSGGERESEMWKRVGLGWGRERERNFSLAFFDALQTSRPFSLSPRHPPLAYL